MTTPRASRWTLWLGTSAVLVGGLAVAWSSIPSSVSGRSGRADGESKRAAKTTATRSEPKPLPMLEEAQRTHLWKVEHQGNVLSKNGFKAVAQALARADADALTAILAEDFRGQVPSRTRDVVLKNEIILAVRGQPDGQSTEPLDRAGFVARLLEFRERFAATPEVKLSLKGLGPVDRDHWDGPWQGSCLLRIWGESAPGKPAEVALQLAYRISKPDEDSLGKPGWMRECSIVQSQTAEASRPLFREAAAERGLRPELFHDNWKLAPTKSLPNTGGAYLCDFDRDGRLDLLVTDAARTAFYRGLAGGKFEDVTERVGLPVGPRTWAVFADLDNDGWEDVVLDRRVFRNEKGRRFEDKTDYAIGLDLPHEISAITLADYDRDGLIDLYVSHPGTPKASSWLEGVSGDPRGNYLFRNHGNWKFEDVTHSAGADAGRRSVFTTAWLDADDDGWPDLYVINEFGDGVLLVNRRDGSFAEHHTAEGPGDFGSMGLTVGDIDNDGRIDLYAANMYSKAGGRVFGNLKPGTYPEDVWAIIRRFVTGSQMHHNLGGLKFEQVGQAMQVNDAGWAFGATLADLDNDGLLDLHATCGFISQSRDDPDG